MSITAEGKLGTYRVSAAASCCTCSIRIDRLACHESLLVLHYTMAASKHRPFGALCFLLLAALTSQSRIEASRRRFAVLIRGETFRGFFHPKFETQFAKEQFRCTSPTVASQMAVLNSLSQNVIRPLQPYGEVELYLSLTGCEHEERLNAKMVTALNETDARIVWSRIGPKERTQAILVERGIGAIVRSGEMYDFAIIVRADLAVTSPLVRGAAEVDMFGKAYISTSGDWFISMPGTFLGAAEEILRGGCELPAQEDPEHATHLVKCSAQAAVKASSAGFWVSATLPCAMNSTSTTVNTSSAMSAGDIALLVYGKAGHNGRSATLCPFPLVMNRIYSLLLSPAPGRLARRVEVESFEAMREQCELLWKLGGPACSANELRGAQCDAVWEGSGGNRTAIAEYGGPACLNTWTKLPKAKEPSLLWNWYYLAWLIWAGLIIRLVQLGIRRWNLAQYFECKPAGLFLLSIALAVLGAAWFLRRGRGADSQALSLGNVAPVRSQSPSPSQTKTLWIYQDKKKLKWYRQFCDQIISDAVRLGVPVRHTTKTSEIKRDARRRDVLLLLGKAQGGGYGAGCEGSRGKDLLDAVLTHKLTPVFYETEGYVVPQARHNYVLGTHPRALPFAEVWTYSHEIIRLLDPDPEGEHGIDPSTRAIFLPPGYSKNVDYRQHPARGKTNASSAVTTVMGGWEERLSSLTAHLPPGALVNVRTAWDDALWANLVASHHVAVDVHKRVADSPNGMVMDSNFFRLSPLLSSGQRVVSERCNKDDERALSGFVEFGTTDVMAEKVLQLLEEAQNETTRKVISDHISEEYQERFNFTRMLATELSRLGFEPLAMEHEMGMRNKEQQASNSGT